MRSLGLLLALVLGTQMGCCVLRTRGRVQDKLEAYGIVGFDKPPCCPSPPKPYRGRQIKPGEELTVWMRLVYYDRLRTPIAGRTVTLSVVTPLGGAVNQPEVTLTPASVRTSAHGYNFEPIRFRSTVRGEYLIRAKYADKQGESASYSAPILVQGAP